MTKLIEELVDQQFSLFNFIKLREYLKINNSSPEMLKSILATKVRAGLKEIREKGALNNEEKAKHWYNTTKYLYAHCKAEINLLFEPSAKLMEKAFNQLVAIKDYLI